MQITCLHTPNLCCCDTFSDLVEQDKRYHLNNSEAIAGKLSNHRINDIDSRIECAFSKFVAHTKLSVYKLQTSWGCSQHQKWNYGGSFQTPEPCFVQPGVSNSPCTKRVDFEALQLGLKWTFSAMWDALLYPSCMTWIVTNFCQILCPYLPVSCLSIGYLGSEAAKAALGQYVKCLDYSAVLDTMFVSTLVWPAGPGQGLSPRHWWGPAHAGTELEYVHPQWHRQKSALFYRDSDHKLRLQ